MEHAGFSLPQPTRHWDEALRTSLLLCVGWYLLGSSCSVKPPEMRYHVPQAGDSSLSSPHRPLHHTCSNTTTSHNTQTSFHPNCMTLPGSRDSKNILDLAHTLEKSSPCPWRRYLPAPWSPSHPSTAPFHQADDAPAGAGPTHQPLCRRRMWGTGLLPSCIC